MQNQNKLLKKPELLAPAGNMDKMKKAFAYGADAVYIGGEEYSLRVAADNFTMRQMAEAVDYAHTLGKKVYLTANVIPHNADVEDYALYIAEAAATGVDAAIISDLGLFQITKEVCPELDIHISTQANNVNYKSAEMWHKLGAKRVILARELSLEEMREIRGKVSPKLELEAFVHGAMCMSYSGRCLLSNYMANRDGNGGNCAQPCRWKYYLMEEKRPGQYMPVYENERGTFIFNSKDLCMIEHIDKLFEAGLDSFKVEGRVKSEYYVATVMQAYRAAIDSYWSDPEHYKTDPAWLEELKKVSHRAYTTGFFFEKPKADAHNYADSSYIRDYELLGIVKEYDKERAMVSVVQKNRFFTGTEVEFLRPGGAFFKQKIEYMEDDNHIEIDVANKPQSIVHIRTELPIEPESMMRAKRQK